LIVNPLIGVLNESFTGSYENLYLVVSLAMASGRNSIFDDLMILGLNEEVILISSLVDLSICAKTHAGFN
jgi:hypothetical protein